MKSLISSLIGFVLSVSVSAAPLIEGQVRLDSGEPVANAQVRIFDMTDLQRGAIARATTDATGYFALPLASLGGSALPQAWTLGQNYPNPFNPSTLISANRWLHSHRNKLSLLIQGVSSCSPYSPSSCSP